jgi:hypothetical protein
MAPKTKESRKKKKNPPSLSTQSCPTRGHHPSSSSPEYQLPMPGLDDKGITPEHLQSRLNFLLLLHLVGFVSFFFFVLLITPALFFSYSYSYPFHFPPFLVLQFIVLPTTYSSAPSHLLSPPSSPPPPILPQPVTILFPPKQTPAAD